MKPETYTKKPVTIQAMQWDGTAETTMRIIQWALTNGAEVINWEPKGSHLIIETLEGEMLANPGDWIIQGVMGEFYPIKEAIFRETYEPVEES